MSDLKTKIAQISAKSVVPEGEKSIRLISTAPTLDRDGEVIDTASLHIPIKPKGWKYAKDLTPDDVIDLPFLFDHKWEVEKQIGSVRSMFINADGELETVAGFTSLQRGVEAHTLAKEGHLGNSFSGTFDYASSYSVENIIYEAEMIELSMVFKGSNRDAHVIDVSKSVKGKQEKMTKFTEQELAEKKLAVKKMQEEIDAAETDEAKAAKEAEEAKAAEEAKKAEDEKKAAEEAKNKESKSVSTAQQIAAGQIVPKAAPVQPVKKAIEEDKYDFAARQFTAWVNKDQKALAELNQKAIDSYKNARFGSKATFMNAGVTADGGAIVPNAQLMKDVFTLLANYSTVASDLRVVTLTEGDSIDVATLVTDVIMSEVTSEGGKKSVTKPVLGDGNVALREFAGIAILTKKLVRQAAVNVYDILAESFARAIANKRAEMALTDTSSGITNKVGIIDVEASGVDVEDYKFSDVKKMPYRIPASAVPGAKYYISRELLEVLDSEKDSQGRDLDNVQMDGDGLSGTFKNKYKFAVEEVLGKNGAPHAVFGAMGRFGILLRQGAVESETFDTGTVKDGADVEHNLLQDNKLAERVAFYENVGYPLPNAFAQLVPLAGS